MMNDTMMPTRVSCRNGVDRNVVLLDTTRLGASSTSKMAYQTKVPQYF